MNFICVTVDTTHEGIEPVTERLLSLGITGVEIEDAQEFKAFLRENKQCWDYVDHALCERMSGGTKVKFYLPDTAAGRKTLSAVRQSLDSLSALDEKGLFGTLELSLSALSEDDWANSWKQYFKPIAVGKRFLVRPEWERIDTVPEDRIVLSIEPGMLFGSGAHETTRLCLEALEETVTEGARVLDIGCGSGILAVGALLLGAGSAVCVDIDPAAEDAVRGNAGLNGIAPERLEVLVGDAVSDGPLRQRIGKGYDIVCANIVADVILALLPALSDFLKPSGYFAASGIIGARAEDVRCAACAAGLVLERKLRENDWVCFLFRTGG